MGMMKNYLLNLLQQCSEEQFGQEVIEWAILSGKVHLSYDLDEDVRAIMARYDELIEAYRRSAAHLEGALRTAPAPMQRAVSGRKAEAGGSQKSVRRRRAA